MKQTFYLIMSFMAGAIALICFISVLDSCSTPNNLGGSYTRLYPITSYEIGPKYIEAMYTLEDGSEGSLQAKHPHVYFHEGEDTLVVISSDKDGKGLDSAKEVYLYLNDDKAAEYIVDYMKNK